MAKAKRPAKTATAEQVQTTTLGMLPQHQPMRVPYTSNAAPKAYTSWVYACASIRAQAVASVPLRLYTKSRKELKALGHNPFYTQRAVPSRRKRYLQGECSNKPHATVVTKAMELGDDFEEVIGAPPSMLLRKVNPWQGGFELMTLLCLNLNLGGMAFWFVNRSGVGGVPDLIMDLAPRKVEIVPSNANFIEGYVYGSNDAKPIALTPQEVVYFRRPNPASPWYGKAPIEAAWQVIELNGAVHDLDIAFYRNYGRPDYIASVAGTTANEDTLKRFREQVAAQVGGKSKAGRMLTVTGQVDIKPLSFAPKDLSGRDEIVEEICAIMGVPVSMVKANDPNLASAQQGYAMYRENSIATDCRLIEDVLNQTYLPLWGLEGEAVFAFDDPIPQNVEQDSVIADRRLKAAVVTVNEVRAEEGLDPLDDPMADKPLFNGQPLGASAVLPNYNSQPFNTTFGAESSTAETDKPQEPVAGAEATNPRSATSGIATDPTAAVQDTALNGAQVTSLVELAVQAREGVLPVETARAIAGAAFPLMTPAELDAIFNPIKAAPPLPKPEPVSPPNGGRDNEPTDFSKNPSASKVPETASAEKSARPNGGVVFQKSLLFTGTGCTHTKAVDPYPEQDVDRERIDRFVQSLDKVIRDQVNAVIAVLQEEGLRGQALIDAAVDEAQRIEWVYELQRVSRANIAPVLEQSGTEAAGRLVSPTGAPVEFQFTNPEVSRWIDRESLRMATGVNETTVVRLRDVLGDGLEQGQTIDELTKTVSQKLGVDAPRAEMIARTESARAYEQGQIEAWKQAGFVTGKKWLLAPDACQFCRSVAREFASNPVPLDQPFIPLGGTIQGVSGGTMKIDYAPVDGAPLHPGCLLPGTSVLARGVVAAYSAVYDGEAIELSTAHGRRISVTANHMLLTARGFVAAKSIREGDYVIASGRSEGVALRNPDYDYGPTAIEEMVGAFSVSGGVTTRRVPVAPEYLHGDGRYCDSHIDVVAADSLLRNHGEASFGKGIDGLPLCADWGGAKLASLGLLDSMLVGLSLSAHGVVRCASDDLPLRCVHGCHAVEHGRRSITLAKSRLLHVSDKRDATYAKSLRSLLHAFSGLVTLDEVVNVKRFNWSGHVYDLQTESGLHIDNGIVTSNCRCSTEPVLEGEQ